MSGRSNKTRQRPPKSESPQRDFDYGGWLSPATVDGYAAIEKRPVREVERKEARRRLFDEEYCQL